MNHRSRLGASDEFRNMFRYRQTDAQTHRHTDTHTSKIEGTLDGIFGPFFAGLDPFISNCTLLTVERVQFLVRLGGKGPFPAFLPKATPRSQSERSVLKTKGLVSEQ